MKQFYSASTTGTTLEFRPVSGFQSANNGGGVKTIYVAGDNVVTNVRFSIVEYGTGGNIDWYK